MTANASIQKNFKIDEKVRSFMLCCRGLLPRRQTVYSLTPNLLHEVEIMACLNQLKYGYVFFNIGYTHSLNMYFFPLFTLIINEFDK